MTVEKLLSIDGLKAILKTDQGCVRGGGGTNPVPKPSDPGDDPPPPTAY